MTGKEGAYPVYPLYNYPSKKNVIVCKTNLPVFLTNFSLSATPFQTAHGRAWFHAAASLRFCQKAVKTYVFILSHLLQKGQAEKTEKLG